MTSRPHLAWLLVGLPLMSAAVATPSAPPPPNEELLEFLGSADTLDPELAQYWARQNAKKPIPAPPAPVAAPASGDRPDKST